MSTTPLPPQADHSINEPPAPPPPEPEAPPEEPAPEADHKRKHHDSGPAPKRKW